jgi:GxxExxY protein
MKKEIENLIEKVKECAKDVYQELGSGWEEDVYQKAMEVALREKGIKYEAQRTLPISFRGFVVGRGHPDLIVWYQKGKKKVAIVVELKSVQEINLDSQNQVERYMQELKKELKENEELYPRGFVFDFTKPKGKLKEKPKDYHGLKILEVEMKS